MSLFERAKEAHRQIAAEHPALFSLAYPVPFALHIHLEIKRRYPAFSMREVSKMMEWLTRRRAYLQTLVAGHPRFGFTGPNGAVTEGQEARARIHFSERNRKAEDKWPEWKS